MSTVLAVSAAGVLAVAEGADAQGMYEPNTLWLASAVGAQRAVSISDKQSDGGWRLAAARNTPIRCWSAGDRSGN